MELSKFGVSECHFSSVEIMAKHFNIRTAYLEPLVKFVGLGVSCTRRSENRFMVIHDYSGTRQRRVDTNYVIVH